MRLPKYNLTYNTWNLMKSLAQNTSDRKHEKTIAIITFSITLSQKADSQGQVSILADIPKHTDYGTYLFFLIETMGFIFNLEVKLTLHK